ncbi:MAG: hypothetical protein JF599_14165 [Verrucomicrobia bacterium]|nr:hypothetical protein [Verrucomicrobiota bacterium]
MTICNETLKLQGKSYPRTCAKCGLGPCVGSPMPAPAPTLAAPALVHVVTWRYGDNSAFGVVSVHPTRGGAERMVNLLEKHAETKQFKIEPAPAEAT